MTSELSETMNRDADTVGRALAKRLVSGVDEADFSLLFDAMRYTAESGGKRIRPFLTLQFCRGCGGDEAAALPFALAVECVHSYSLIHDDLPCMDNDDLRRGLPSNHIRFGEATALLAGDGLLTEAFALCAGNYYASDAAVRKAVLTLSECAGPRGMVGGQQLDLMCAGKPDTIETLLKTHHLKTSCLIRAACCLGCIAAGCEDLSPAEVYADNFGMAFQITDDLLDGKKDGENSILNYIGETEAHGLANDYIAKAVSAVSEIDDRGLLGELARFLAERKK